MASSDRWLVGGYMTDWKGEMGGRSRSRIKCQRSASDLLERMVVAVLSEAGAESEPGIYCVI